MMKFVDEDIFRIHAEFCKTLANSRRLKILAMLSLREMCVSEMAEAMDVPLANVSQHLTVLRTRHIVQTRKDGKNVYYHLVDKRLNKACNLIRSVLLDGLKARGVIAQEVDAANVVLDQ